MERLLPAESVEERLLRVVTLRWADRKERERDSIEIVLIVSGSYLELILRYELMVGLQRR